MTASSPTAPNLSFPLLAPAQALKHITVNEALCALDAVAQITVERSDLDAPPDSPVANARFVVGDGATGAWSGRDGTLAQWRVIDDPGGTGPGHWHFVEPDEGWILWDRSAARLMIRRQDGWTAHDAALTTPDRLGVNTTPDDVNRLSVASASTLLSHDGADHRVTVNRAGANDTASLLFKTDHVADAEVGLTGSGGLSIKTFGAPDGQAPLWRTALSVDPATGSVRLPDSGYARGGQHNLFKDSGLFMGAPQPTSLAAQAFVAPSWALPHNGSVIDIGETFHHNSATNGGSSPANGTAAQALAAATMDPVLLRYVQSFHTARVTSGTGTSFATTGFSDGITRYLSFRRSTHTAPLTMTYSVYLYAETAPVGCLSQDAVNPDGVALRIDGQLATGSVLVPADGQWHHLTIQDEGNPRTHLRRDTLSLRFFSEPGSTYQIGFPAAMAGLHDIDGGIGPVPSLDAFSR